MLSNKFRFQCENKKKLPPLLDSNKDVSDALLMCGKNPMGYPNFLEGMFCYFHDKVIPYLLKLMNSPSLTNHKDLSSLIEYEERDETKNTPATRDNQIIIQETYGSITKEDIFLSHILRCVLFQARWTVGSIGLVSIMKPEKLLHRQLQERYNNRVPVGNFK